VERSVLLAVLPSTATTLLAAIVGAMAALTGFVLTVSVLVVQMASSTFSARYMRLWYGDRLLKLLLAVLIGTLTFSFGLLRRVESDSVPDVGLTVAGGLVVVSLILFLLFLDRFLHRLRPVAVAALVAEHGRRAFLDVVRTMDAPEAPHLVLEPYRSDEEPTVVVRSRRAGAIQAVDATGLGRFAADHDCLLVLRHSVGDFVPTGGTLVEAYGGAFDPDDAERQLNGTVVLGVERTIEQDPAFAMRIMVDIANQGALSRTQRPDHRGAGAQPPRRPTQVDRHDRRRTRGRPGGTSRGRDRGTALGGLPRARRDGDQGVRRFVGAGHAPAARVASRAARGSPPREPPGRRGRARTARREGGGKPVRLA
jgi:Predicted membrane protein (DUF2254)